jgi:hypothetical protein
LCALTSMMISKSSISGLLPGIQLPHAVS